MVCERLNIHNPSAEYLSNYVDKNNKIPNVSIDTILKSTNMIENMLRSTIAIKKRSNCKIYRIICIYGIYIYYNDCIIKYAQIIKNRGED